MKRAAPSALHLPLALGLAAFAACSLGGAAPAAAGDIVPLAPLPPPPIPADNPQSEVKVELGRMLFFDPRLSADGGVACASCHPPDKGWTDGTDICRGYPGTANWRNCPSVVNAAYHEGLFWDGRGPRLEAQAEGAATSPVEGNGNPFLMEERLRQVPEYRRLFREAFGEPVKIENAWKAISAFERTIVQRDTPLDRYLAGDLDALSDEAKLGFAIFAGKGGCLQCHHGPLLTDGDFHATGTPDPPGFAEQELQQITFRFHHSARGVPKDVYAKSKTDLGRYYVTQDPNDMGKFRTPSLRFVEHTPPYMHDGTFFTLEEIVDFYDQGGGTDRVKELYGVATKSELLKPLGLTDSEKAALVAFLESLDSGPIVVEAPKLPEYGKLVASAQ